jgi:hypothetical protein
MNIELDARGILPAISVPSIVLHRAGDADVNIEEGRYIAAHIPDCRFVELPGNDHFENLGDQEPMFAAIESFLSELSTLRSDVAHGQKLATVLCLEIPLGAPHLTQAASETIRATIEEYDGNVVDQELRKRIALFDGSIRAMNCAQSISNMLRTSGLEGRIGIHSGPVEAGTTASGAIWIAIQLASMASSGNIIATESVKNISPGSGFEFESLGAQAFAGMETALEVFLVLDRATDTTATS